MNDISEKLIAYYSEHFAKISPEMPVKYDGPVKMPNDDETKKIIRGYLGKLPSSIGVGGRWETLRSIAVLLHKCGVREQDIRDRLSKFNKDRCNPIKSESELKSDIDRFMPWVLSLPQGLPTDGKKEENDSKPSGEILKEARRIYETGQFIQYCRDAYRKIWFKDQFVLDALMLSVAIGRIKQSDNGLHIFLSGDTQSGKTQAVKKAMKFIHPRNKMIKSFSMKYLFYASEGELKENTLVFSDDTQFNDEEAKFFRGILTSWDTGSNRGTVNNGESKELHIPPRVSLILTNIDSVCGNTDDGQDESRFFNLEIRRTPEDIKTIMDLRQDEVANIDHELSVIMAVWELIPEMNSVRRHRKVTSDLTLREFNRYLELVTGHALLCGRTLTNDDDFIEVEALLGNTIKMVDSTTAGFTRREIAVIQVLNDCQNHDVNEISKKAKMSPIAVYKALRGKSGTFRNASGGLLAKVKGNLSHIVERSDLENDRNVFVLSTPIKINQISL